MDSDEEEDDEEEEQGKASDEDEDMDETINVEFEFFNQKEDDAIAVRTLLNNTLAQGVSVDCRELSTLICSSNVGSVIKVGGADSDPLGFLTVLDVTARPQLPACLGEIRNFLLKFGSAQPAAQQILNSGQPVGVILNERLVNVPDELVPQLHKQLFEEIEEQERQTPNSPKFANFVLISAYSEVAQTRARGKPQMKRTRQGGSDASRDYDKFEEEAYAAEAACTYLYPRKTAGGGAPGERWTFAGTVKSRGLVAFVHRGRIPAVLQRIEQLCK
eukprot:TRINITY_DN18534_c0_g1_i1.p1 TRINITY_DN18534_c0_g1~~TRINITY_DN18534_c0_g1_i1.p1  ORF type:complete len:315 (-),score=102.53 TRINITY_DN18534_c0_g1_i1:105-926(-)